MISNYLSSTSEKETELMRDEIKAMLRVCFEGEVEQHGDKIRLILPDGKAYALYVCKD